MPRVPTYNERQIAPQPIGTARLSENVSPESFGAGVGRAIQQTGGVLAAVAENEREKQGTARLLENDRLDSDWELEHVDRDALSRRGKDTVSLTAEVLREFDRETSRREMGLPDRLKLRYRAMIQGRRQAIGTKLERHTRAELEGYQAAETKAYELSTIDAAGANWSDAKRVDQEIVRAEEAIRSSAQLGGEPAAVTDLRLADHRSLVHLAVLKAAASAGDHVYAEEYFAARKEELRGEHRLTAEELVKFGQAMGKSDAIVAAYRMDVRAGDRALAKLEESKLPPEVVDAVRRHVREGVSLMRSERQEQYAEQIAALAQDVADGDPSPRAEQSAYQFYRRGAFSPAEFESSLASITRARTANAKSTADLEMARQALATGTRLDPKDGDARDGMDQLFRSTGLTPASPNYATVAAELAAKTNIAPASAISWARASMISDDPETVARGADLFARVEEAAPAAYGFTVDEKTQAFASLVNDAVRAGTPAAVAVDVARKTVERTKPHQEMLDQAYRTSKATAGNHAALVVALDSDNRYDRSLIRGAPESPPALVAEYDAGVERYYAHVGGDLKKARELAYRDVRRKWGYSEINGKPELMPYAPELMYGITRDVVLKDFEAALAATPVNRLNLESGENEPAPVKPEELRLVPTAETARTDGREWSVGYVGDYGELEVLLGPDNRPLRYRLPGGDALKAARDALATQKLAEARAQAKKQREYLELLEREADAGDEDARRRLEADIAIHGRPSEGIQ